MIFDSICIGNAICDILAPVEEDFLVKQKLTKGAMRLIDIDEAERLISLIDSVRYVSGGCAGSSAAGIASLGGKAAYLGKVADDALGAAYREDMRREGVHFSTPPTTEGPPTARSIILITPDSERTMNTYLGACLRFGPDDIKEEELARTQAVFMEGYLWDPPAAKDAFLKAAAIAAKYDNRVALSLSDTFCVDRFRSEFLHLIRSKTINLLFANEHELMALYETKDLGQAIEAIKNDCPLTALTLGARGAAIITPQRIIEVPSEPVARTVDLTGAGDLFVSGFLYALARKMDLAAAGRLGCLCGARIIQDIGARANRPLSDLIALI